MNEIVKQKITDIEKEIFGMKESRSHLSERKKGYERNLSELNLQVRGKTLRQSEYNEISRLQFAVKRQISDVEQDLMKLKLNIHKRTIERDDLARKYNLDKRPEEKGDLKKKIFDLKNHYMEFASDKTRIATTRQMAAEFAVKLQEILSNS